MSCGDKAQPAPWAAPPLQPQGSLTLTLKGFMEFWIVGTIHCKGGHSVSSCPLSPQLGSPVPTHPALPLVPAGSAPLAAG